MSTAASPRFVVLGASNVSHSFPALVALARGAHESRIEILAAYGHGRSWIGWSRVLLARELPSIGACGLWSALRARTAPETTALVTDIGNDLAYGFSARRIADSVECDLDRLVAARARIVLTRLPLESLARLGSLRFAVAKSLLFPGRDIDLARVRAEALELDARLEVLAHDRGITLVTPSLDWYGFDPIHVRRSMRATAHALILAPLFGAVRERPFVGGERALLRRARPAFRRLFGREQHCEQPCLSFGDGTTVSWY